METKTIKKHENCAVSEIWVGNTSDIAAFPKPHLKHLKTLRLGKVAYDIHGLKIAPSYCLPVFVDKTEFEAYDTAMMTEGKRQRSLIKRK